MKEVWKTTSWDYIEISNFGQVRTKDIERLFPFYDRHHKTFRKVWRRTSSHFMSVQENNKGYLFVCAKEEGRRKNLLIHRLVAEAFIPNPENKPEVNHIDGNPHNNKVDNLEWVTSSENRKHAYRVLGRPCFGRLPKTKGAALILCLVALCGCADKTPVETISDNAMAQVVALEKTLPNECKTDAVLAQLVSIRAEIASAPQACELQIKPIRQQRNGYAIALFALIALIIARFVKKVV